MFDPQYPEVDPNKKPAKDVWEAHYAGESYLFGKEPSPFLKAYIGALRKGKALDIAMGEGRNTVFLAKNGFEAEGVDVSPKAVEKAKKLAAEQNAKVDVKSQNLDFFLMPLMKYDTIVMAYFKPLPRFFSEIRRGLVAGGTALFEAYTVEHYKANQSKMPHLAFEDCYKPNELLRALKDFHVLYYKEMQEGDSHIVQAIAKKVQN